MKNPNKTHLNRQTDQEDRGRGTQRMERPINADAGTHTGDHTEKIKTRNWEDRGRQIKR